MSQYERPQDGHWRAPVELGSAQREKYGLRDGYIGGLLDAQGVAGPAALESIFLPFNQKREPLALFVYLEFGSPELWYAHPDVQIVRNLARMGDVPLFFVRAMDERLSRISLRAVGAKAREKLPTDDVYPESVLFRLEAGLRGYSKPEAASLALTIPEAQQLDGGRWPTLLERHRALPADFYGVDLDLVGATREHRRPKFLLELKCDRALQKQTKSGLWTPEADWKLGAVRALADKAGIGCGALFYDVPGYSRWQLRGLNAAAADLWGAPVAERPLPAMMDLLRRSLGVVADAPAAPSSEPKA